MPHLRVELHDRRSEGVFVGYSNVDVVCAALVRCTGRAFEGSFKVEQVRTITDGIGGNVRESVGPDVGDLFGYAARSVGRHSKIETLGG